VTKEAANLEFYDADSGTYDEQRWASKGGEFTNRVQQKIVQDLCADWKGRRVLEVGPGTARFTIPLCRMRNRMTLLDVARQMLEVAQRNIDAAGLGDQVEDYTEGSIYELPFEDADFDHAICLNVFNHLDEAAKALKQLARVVKPGSTLLFNYANLQSYYWPAARRIEKQSTALGRDVYSSWKKPAQMRRIISEAGLDLVTSAGHVHMPRELQKLPMLPLVRMLDAVSRRGPLRRFAPVHFCLCRRHARSPQSAG